jgi:catechol 2,3-dioxygenase-like lactoylglutathione lyase family enzyme
MSEHRTEATATARGPITSVRAVGVPVTDQDRAVDFYVHALGLEKRADVPIAQFGRWIELAPPGGPTPTIALVPAHPDAPAGVETGIRFSAPDVEAAHATLAARGVDVDDILYWEGVPPMFVFRDPDGNRFEIVP